MVHGSAYTGRNTHLQGIELCQFTRQVGTALEACELRHKDALQSCISNLFASRFAKSGVGPLISRLFPIKVGQVKGFHAKIETLDLIIVMSMSKG